MNDRSSLSDTITLRAHFLAAGLRPDGDDLSRYEKPNWASKLCKYSIQISNHFRPYCRHFWGTIVLSRASGQAWQPVKHWEGVRQATGFGPRCMQPPDIGRHEFPLQWDERGLPRSQIRLSAFKRARQGRQILWPNLLAWQSRRGVFYARISGRRWRMILFRRRAKQFGEDRFQAISPHLVALQ